MTHNALRKKVQIIHPQKSVVTSFQRSNHPARLPARREKPPRFRSKKNRTDQIQRRGMSKKKLLRTKIRTSKMPCIPQRVLRVLKILRHEKFLDLVDKYFKPFEGTKKSQSEIQQPINENLVVTDEEAEIK